METLSIRTDFPSVQTADFSVLPSPSTFFSLSGNTYPSPTFDQYPISATDYHQHFLPPPTCGTAPASSVEEAALPADSAVIPLSSSRSALSDCRDTPSPASSFPSTPTGSPIPQNLALEQAEAEKRQVSSLNSKFDSPVEFEMFEDDFHLSQQQTSQFNSSNGFQPFSAISHFPPPVHHICPPPQHAIPQYAPVTMVQAQAYSSVVGDGLVYVNGLPQYAQAQQQAIAYAMPPAQPAYPIGHAAPAPTAIETPLGTYYFVPNVAAPQQQAQPAVTAPSPPPPHHLHQTAAVKEPVQLPSPPSHMASPPVELSATTLDANPYAGFVQLANGLTAGVAIAQATTGAQRSPTGVTATVVVGDQKIRLPVGQGKKGSTKRPAKKDQVKKFICPHPGCGRGFARNFNMQSHHKSHLGIREFECPYCPKKFSRRHDRARHCSAVHASRVDRDGNITGSAGSASSASIGSRTPSSDGEDFDDSFEEDKNFQLDGYAD